MKPLFLIFFFSCSLTSWSQTDADKLLTEIRNAPSVQSFNIGCYGHRSVLYKNVDSLKQLVTPSSFQQYFNDPSPVLKYYAFLEILYANDEMALEKFQTVIGDTTPVNFEFAGQNHGTLPLNEFLATVYIQHIEAKYKGGGSMAINRRIFQFAKKNKRTWKTKNESFRNLLTQHSVRQDRLKLF